MDPRTTEQASKTKAERLIAESARRVSRAEQEAQDEWWDA